MATMIGTSLIASGRVPTTIGTSSFFWCCGLFCSYIATRDIGARRRALELLRQEFLQQAARRTEQVFQRVESRARVADQFDCLIQWQVFDDAAQRAGDERTQ